MQHAPGAPGKAALDACLNALGESSPGCLAIVLEVFGHAYGKPGTLLHLAADGRRCGWISPGCLENEVVAAAGAAGTDLRARLLDLDNRDLTDVFSGGGAGCRGRQRVLLLPLAALPGLRPLLQAYRTGDQPLQLHYAQDGRLELRVAALAAEWALATVPAPADSGCSMAHWALRLAPLPRALIFGCGPESEILLPLLDRLGWRLDLVEARRDWAALGRLVENHLAAAPTAPGGSYAAVLVMAHQFGADREALAELATWPRLPPYIGLLGPQARRDDLLATLPAPVRTRLRDRVESPAGLTLGGRGAAAIALSLAARLQGLVAGAPA